MMMTITGKNIIGKHLSGDGGSIFNAENPVTGRTRIS